MLRYFAINVINESYLVLPSLGVPLLFIAFADINNKIIKATTTTTDTEIPETYKDIVQCRRSINEIEFCQETFGGTFRVSKEEMKSNGFHIFIELSGNHLEIHKSLSAEEVQSLVKRSDKINIISLPPIADIKRVIRYVCSQ
uniref:Uncharacterized protein n=1 Tax=Glossina brevipalpis TaxID=37001 RepID=A0A1A9WHU3_9MUSC